MAEAESQAESRKQKLKNHSPETQNSRRGFPVAAGKT